MMTKSDESMLLLPLAEQVIRIPSKAASLFAQGQRPSPLTLLLYSFALSGEGAGDVFGHSLVYSQVGFTWSFVEPCCPDATMLGAKACPRLVVRRRGGPHTCAQTQAPPGDVVECSAFRPSFWVLRALKIISLAAVCCVYEVKCVVRCVVRGVLPVAGGAKTAGQGRQHSARKGTPSHSDAQRHQTKLARAKVRRSGDPPPGPPPPMCQQRLWNRAGRRRDRQRGQPARWEGGCPHGRPRLTDVVERQSALLLDDSQVWTVGLRQPPKVAQEAWRTRPGSGERLFCSCPTPLATRIEQNFRRAGQAAALAHTPPLQRPHNEPQRHTPRNHPPPPPAPSSGAPPLHHPHGPRRRAPPSPRAGRRLARAPWRGAGGAPQRDGGTGGRLRA